MRSLIVCLCAGMILTIAHASLAGPPGGNGAAGGPPPDGGGEVPRGGGGGGGGQGPRGGGHRGGPPGQGGNSENMIQQIMALDANGDGGLTPAEVTDLRLQTLLQQADTDSSGSVTLTELTTAMNKKPGQGMGGPGMGGPGMGGGHGGPGGPPRPGEIMPGFIQDQLQLTDTQRQQLATLQSGVDAQLMQILTTQQIQQLAAGPQNFGNGNGAKGSGRKGRSSKNSQ